MGKRTWLCWIGLCILLSGCGANSASMDLTESARTETVYSSMSVQDVESASQKSIPEAAMNDTSAIEETQVVADAQEVQTDVLTYFVFSQNTTTHTDDQGKDLLLESLTETSFYSENDAQKRWVNGILEELHRTDANYSTELLGYATEDLKSFPDHFYCYSHYVTRGIARHDERVISMLSQTCVYSGGAHPTTVQTAYNLDMQQLRILTLEDVVEEGASEQLYEMILKRVEDKFASTGLDGLFEDYPTVISDAVSYGKMTPYWYFNDRGLVFFFNQYELAPYAAGIIKVELEYSGLSGILKEEYLPQPQTEGATDLTISGAPQSQGQDVFEVRLGSGETIYLSIQGAASQVQLSDVQFVEQSAVSSTMLFSANRINEETTFAITGNLDADKTYALVYHDPSNETVVLYFQGNQLLESLDETPSS